MLNLDPSKLLIIGVVAIILLGPNRLPQVARQAGAAWRSFNDFRHRMETEVRSTIPDLPSSAEIARLARSPSALLNHLSTLSPDDPAAADTNGTAPAEPANATAGESAVGAADAGATSGDPARAESSETDSPAPPAATPTSTVTPTVHPHTAPASTQGSAPTPAPPVDPSLN